jgi:RES domain-containing protein
VASDPITALDEVGAILDLPSVPPSTLRTPPWTVFAVEGFLQKVLDLTDPRLQGRLGTSLSELTGDWRYSQALYLKGEAPLPPTQLLGQIAYETGAIVGMKYHSAKNTGKGTAVVVFSDRLVESRASFLEVYDPYELIRQRLP